jgi:penicillin-binding protein 1B
MPRRGNNQAPPASRPKQRRPRKVGLPWRLRLLLLFLISLVIAAGWLLWPFWRLAGQFDPNPARQPSRLYGRATPLEVGQTVDREALIEELRALGYRAVGPGEAPPEGRYRADSDRLVVHLRSFLTASGRTQPAVLEVDLRGRQVSGLRWDGRGAELVLLEPPLIASYYGADRKERRPVTLERVPPHLVTAVLAMEDDSFYSHPGLSPTGILRAAWVNLTGGGVSQGGSTLTQQLVKNLFLSHERTWSRKAREAVLAVFLEVRYPKDVILQAYLNEIYLGSDGHANVIGVGAAARAYFGKDVESLDLAEAATLAGIIRSPANYSPLKHPQRAKERRNLVLDRLATLKRFPAAEIEAARARPLGSLGDPRSPPAAHYFADLVAEEAHRRFGVGNLEDAGYALLTTLEAPAQAAAVESVGWGLASLEKGWEKGKDRGGPLQGALVSMDPATGGIRAYVGGRNYGASQFDRARHGRRQAGSAFKPVVYAAAFDAGRYAPASMVEDAPLVLPAAGGQWAPQNDDDGFDGWMSVRTALERSRNVPTVRVAMDVGMDTVVATARRMGVTANLRPLPSLALGSFEVTPLEMTTVYGTLANNGVRPPVHGVTAVFDRHGRRVGTRTGETLPEPQKVLSPQAAFLLTSVLQGVLDRGTAKSLRQAGLTEPLAGKTGTTNDRRDSWFAGYSRDRVTVVWVGYDNNAPTRLSGTRAALPIWGRFTLAVRPPGGYGTFPQPPGITTAVVDPESGQLATDHCPTYLTEYFLTGREPTTVCRDHSRWWRRDRPREADETRREEDRRERHRFREWLDRMRGRGGE